MLDTFAVMWLCKTFWISSLCAMSDRTPPPTGRLLVSGCDVLRVPAQGECEILRAQDIVVADGAIEDVRPTGGPIGSGPAADVIDGRGLLAVPGLVNAHTHSPMVLMRGAAEDVTVEGWFNDRVWPMESNLTPADVRIGARLACAEMIRSGVTTFADHYSTTPSAMVVRPPVPEARAVRPVATCPGQCSAHQYRVSAGLNRSAPSCEATSSGSRRTALPERLLAAAFVPQTQVPCGATDMSTPPRFDTVHILRRGSFGPRVTLGQSLRLRTPQSELLVQPLLPGQARCLLNQSVASSVTDSRVPGSSKRCVAPGTVAS